MTKTTLATAADHQAAMDTWHLVDASKYVLGRMAARIAEILMGKHKPLYTPHLSVGEGVIVVNAGKVKLTSNKGQTRIYRHYTGYPGGLRSRSLEKYREQKPEELIKLAVRRMLPKSRLGPQMPRRLKVYAGDSHPHAAQKPQELNLNQPGTG
jgi:large subunit ribosomal protein L13